MNVLLWTRCLLNKCLAVPLCPIGLLLSLPIGLCFKVKVGDVVIVTSISGQDIGGICILDML